jgi:hypothetical protein
MFYFIYYSRPEDPVILKQISNIILLEWLCRWLRMELY